MPLYGKHTRSSRKASPRSRQGGSALQKFEWRLRGDVRLNATARLAWLLTALSKKRPATMSAAKMAVQLGTSEWVVYRALRKLVALSLFEKTAGGYARSPPKRDFARRVRKCGSLNLAVRVAWLLVDLSSAADGGKVTISLGKMAAELNSNRGLVSAAAQKLLGLGLFSRLRDGNGNRKSTYEAAIIGSSGLDDGPIIDQDGNPVNDDEPSFEDDTGHFKDYFAAKYGRKADGSRRGTQEKTSGRRR